MSENVVWYRRVSSSYWRHRSAGGDTANPNVVATHRRPASPVELRRLELITWRTTAARAANVTPEAIARVGPANADEQARRPAWAR